MARQIADAKADGDISENAGYDEAKNTQAFVEGRILTLRNILGTAVIIDHTHSNGTVDIGCKVTIRDVEYGDEETYTIVGSTEVDPGTGASRSDLPSAARSWAMRSARSSKPGTPGGAAEFEITRIQ